MIGRGKILAVDDNPTNLLFYEELLDEDFELVLAHSGEEALEQLENFRPDVILLDIMMPGIDGYEVCRQIRGNDSKRHLKIILVSAKNQLESRLEGYEAGADDYITKPFDEFELIAKIQVYLKLNSVEELDSFKTDLMSRLGTEMLTPLSGILAPLHYVMENGDDVSGDERYKTLARVKNNAQWLQRLMEKTLVLGSIRSGSFALHSEVNSLKETVSSAIEVVAPMALGSDIKVTVGHASESLCCFDHERIRDIIIYVLENAIEASEPGSVVEIEYGPRDGGCIVKVTDNGHGIAADQLNKIFDFLTSTKPGVLGVKQGVSLHLAREILRAHGGKIVISSIPDDGTVCAIDFPDLADNGLALSA